MKFQKDEYKEKSRWGYTGAATEVIQVSPQAPAARIGMLVNSATLTDGEVRTTLVQMA